MCSGVGLGGGVKYGEGGVAGGWGGYNVLVVCVLIYIYIYAYIYIYIYVFVFSTLRGS